MSTPFSPMMKYMQVVKIHGKFSYAFVFKGLDLIYWEHPSQMLQSGLSSEIHSASIISRWTQDSSIQLNSQAHLVKPVMCIFMKINICKNDNYLFDKESVLGETCFACLHLLEKVGKIYHRRILN